MRRFWLLGVVLALSVGGVLSSVPEDVSASDDILFDAIYFPWVPNNDEINGTGPWHGSITVQNIDVELDNMGVRFWVFDSQTINQIALNNDGEGEEYSLGDALEDPDVPRFDLDANASVTLNAGILGLPEPGSAVAIYAIYKDALGPEAGFDQRAPPIAGVQKQASPQPISDANTSGAHLSIDGYSAIPFPDVAWGSQSDFCYALNDGVNSCDGAGLHGEAGGFDGHSYLPIVQTNTGWNTEIYLSNLDFTAVSSAQVNITSTPSDQQSAYSRNDNRAVESMNIPPGGTVVVDARALVGEEWVGSAQITSTVGIGAVAMRSRPDADMLMINPSAPSLQATTSDAVPPLDGIVAEASTGSYRQYAPLVFREYYGWNTGISFVNLSEERNRVSVSFLDEHGSLAAVDSRTVPPQGQEFIYIPASANVSNSASAGFAGAAIFQSSEPFHVAIDQVKYETGDAMSYLATAAGAKVGETLSLPLVQKGRADGSGDTSGLRVLNPDTSNSVTFELQFFDSAGALVGPTHLQPIRTTLGPHSTSTIYTPDLSGMPQNQRSSAVIRVVDGGGTIVGVSNNVNYTVAGDGSTAFNMVNIHGGYRFSGE